MKWLLETASAASFTLFLFGAGAAHGQPADPGRGERALIGSHRSA